MRIGGGGQHKAVRHDVVVSQTALVCGASDPLHHRDTPHGRGRDPVVIERERNDRSAVARGQRQHGRDRVGTAIDGVDERPPGIRLESSLESHRIGRVDDERNVREARQCVDGARQQRHGVDARSTHVDVEQIRAGVLLLHGEAADHLQRALAQGCRKHLAAGRVDALADAAQRPAGAETDGTPHARERHACRPRAFGQHDPLRLVQDRARERRRGAAARTDEPGAERREASGMLAHLVSRAGKDRLAVDELWQARVRLHHQRQRRCGGHALHQREHLLRSEAAVHADHRGAARLEDHSSGLGVGGGEFAASGEAEGHRRDDRQIRHRTRRQQCAADLSQIGEGLERDRVGVLRSERGDLLHEDVEDLVVRGGSERFHDQAARPDVGQDVLGAGAPGEPDGGAVQLIHAVAEAELRQLGPRSAEAVGGDALRTHGDVRVMDFEHHLGVRDVELFRALARRHAGAVQHRAHGPIDDEDLASEPALDVRHERRISL